MERLEHKNDANSEALRGRQRAFAQKRFHIELQNCVRPNITFDNSRDCRASFLYIFEVRYGITSEMHFV
uniref:Uncharacterized protein n=1 Tax=Papilio xuthus TaxID=66420 RepID=I4DQJ1_PAPXU|nr:unknown unsecreted protein [Papilio xuthus]